MIALGGSAAALLCLLAWAGLGAGGAHYIATHCHVVGSEGRPPPGESDVTYAPGLHAWYAAPRQPDLPTITMVPGYGGDRRDSGPFAAAMQERGYGILRLDLGCSHGAGPYGGGPAEAREVIVGAAFAAKASGGQVVLFGFSAGGTEALMAAEMGAPVAGVITDSAPVHLLNIVKDWHNLPMWMYALTPHFYGLFSDRGHLASVGPASTMPTLSRRW